MDANSAHTGQSAVPAEGFRSGTRRSSPSSGCWWKYAGAKEQAIRAQFGMSATRYYQVLNALIDRPEALAFDPLLVKRLRRLPRIAGSGSVRRAGSGSSCSRGVALVRHDRRCRAGCRGGRRIGYG